MYLLTLFCVAIAAWFGWRFYRLRHQEAQRRRHAACLDAICRLERDLTPLIGWHAGYELARREAQRLEHAHRVERFNVIAKALQAGMNGNPPPEARHARLFALERQFDAVQEWLRHPTDDVPWNLVQAQALEE